MRTRTASAKRIGLVVGRASTAASNCGVYNGACLAAGPQKPPAFVVRSVAGGRQVSLQHGTGDRKSCGGRLSAVGCQLPAFRRSTFGVRCSFPADPGLQMAGGRLPIMWLGTRVRETGTRTRPPLTEGEASREVAALGRLAREEAIASALGRSCLADRSCLRPLLPDPSTPGARNSTRPRRRSGTAKASHTGKCSPSRRRQTRSANE